MTRKVGFWSEFLGLAFFFVSKKLNFGKKEEKREQSDNTNERDRHTQKSTYNVFIQSDKAGVGTPQMVGFGETRADDESFGEERRRKRHADGTESRPEETRDSFPESPFALGRPDRGSEDARHRSRDVYNHTERDKDRN